MLGNTDLFISFNQLQNYLRNGPIEKVFYTSTVQQNLCVVMEMFYKPALSEEKQESQRWGRGQRKGRTRGKGSA